MVRLVISGLVRAAQAFCKNKLEIHRSAGQPEGHQDTGRSRRARGLRWCLPRRASRLATTYAAQGPESRALIGLLPRLPRRVSRSPRGAAAAIGALGAAARG